ncbi:MAG: branched-chain amino acid transaminase [Terriglobales bacterium]
MGGGGAAVMAIKKTKQIWHNGRFIAFDDAKIHVLSHVVSYGSAVFEGIRCYATRRGPAIFRLQDHVRRLLQSAKIYRMDVPFPEAALAQACLDVIRENDLSAAYLRPLVLRGYSSLGVLPTDNPIETFIAAYEWGRYLGGDALEKGADVCVSSWRRMAPDTMPAMAKAASNYMNSQLIKMEASVNGYSEGIALDAQGFVSEGSGENVFLVRGGELLTPPVSSSLLAGITRDTVMQLATELGISHREEQIPREALYLADELFFCGTAVEVTPIRSVDHIPVGSGRRGPVTEAIQRRFFALTSGEAEDKRGWLTPVETLQPAGR